MLTYPRAARRVLLVLLASPLAACGGGSAANRSDAGQDVVASDGRDALDSVNLPEVPAGDGGAGIGEWTDTPGACPAGTTRVDLSTVADIESASRGDGRFASDGPGICYFIHNGTYAEGSSLLMYVRHGGTAAAPVYFIGESRAGVVLRGRASIEPPADHVVVSNLTFDLTGYVHSGSFNTLSLYEVTDIDVSFVTFTGDCATGLKGGHIETNGTTFLTVESCIIEKFGHCAGGGHEDHGVYLASGADLTFRNNVIRGNSSRGIQLYTDAGNYGTLARILIERNRIHANGHADYEDGIVLNGADTGTIDHVTIQRNLIYSNYYSGIRFAGPATSAIVVGHNSFAANGAGSTAAGRSEINVDSAGTAAGAAITRNIFSAGHAVINDCYGGSALGFSLADNLGDEPVPTGAAGSCVSGMTAAAPGYVDVAAGDLHTTNAAAAGFGAYAP